MLVPKLDREFEGVQKWVKIIWYNVNWHELPELTEIMTYDDALHIIRTWFAVYAYRKLDVPCCLDGTMILQEAVRKKLRQCCHVSIEQVNPPTDPKPSKEKLL